jgi:glycosyltransferase involved in cell wall biosynthesis
LNHKGHKGHKGHKEVPVKGWRRNAARLAGIPACRLSDHSGFPTVSHLPDWTAGDGQMNILQVMNGFADRWNANGYAALALAAAQRDLGHKVICVADPVCRFTVEARKLGLPVVELTVDTDNAWRYFGIRRRIGDLIRTEAIDVVHCHRGMMLAAYVRAARAAGRAVRVVRTHGEDRLPRSHWLARREIGRLDGVITTTEAMRGVYLEQFDLAPEQVRTIYGSVSQPVAAAAAAGAPPPGGGSDLILGFIGRPSMVKGHAVAVAALGRVVRDCSRRVVLRFAGRVPGPLRAALEGTMRVHGVPADRVEFAGFVHDIPAFIRGVDIGVIPSVRSEMICRVLMEFTAFGRPVAGSTVNSVGEVIRRFGLGLASPSGDADALAANILRLANDPALLAQCAAGSRAAYAADFIPERFARAVLDFYGQGAGIPEKST